MCRILVRAFVLLVHSLLANVKNGFESCDLFANTQTAIPNDETSTDNALKRLCVVVEKKHERERDRERESGSAKERVGCNIKHTHKLGKTGKKV